MAAAMAFPLTFQGCRSQTATADSVQMRSVNGRPLCQPQRGLPAPATKSRPSSVVVCGKGMNIVFVGAEMAPWSKTGGLGDVLGGLPPAMAANGHRVMTIAPRYDQYFDAWDTSVVVDLKVGDRIERVRFFHCYKRGVDRVFVDHPLFLAKVWGLTGRKLYGPTAGTDYDDNQQRFSLFCQAALLAPRVLHLNNSKYYSGPYGEDVIFVANDWHTGPLPCYLKSIYQSQGMYMNAKVAFCIHNIVYQGRFPLSDYEILNLPERFKSSFEFVDRRRNPAKGSKINWMKAGIIECNKAVTVSPYYARELVSGEDRGAELNNILAAKGIAGILNGMDINEWNPSTDKYIAAKFDATTAMQAKAVNKEALQAEVGLPVDRNIPLIAFCGRLEEQKGSDIFAAAIPKFIDENVQVIVLGTGKGKMETELAQLEAEYPKKVRAHMKFNVPLAHLIMAGADLLAITSRFEPCGLIQLQGMRYGVPCICASTGGLVDTVRDGITGFHMGTFSANCDYVDKDDVGRVVGAVKRALTVYRTPTFARMITNCMNQDLSWKGPAKRWEEFLLGLGASGSEPGIDAERQAAPSLASGRPQRQWPSDGDVVPGRPWQGLLRLIRQHAPNSSQILGLLTLVVSGGILLAFAGVTFTVAALAFVFLGPILLITSPLWVPAAALVFGAMAVVLSACGFCVAAVAGVTWVYRYAMGRHPVGSDRVDYARSRIVDTAGHVKDYAREYGGYLKGRVKDAAPGA